LNKLNSNIKFRNNGHPAQNEPFNFMIQSRNREYVFSIKDIAQKGINQKLNR